MNNEKLKTLIIEKLQLVPLEGEGGLVKNTFISKETYQNRPVGTAIYYLLTTNSYSHLHKLMADEMWHHYFGDPVEMVAIDDKTGKLKQNILGSNIANGEWPQILAPKNTWQGAKLASKQKFGFALMGTTMSPGYMDQDFVLGTKAEMLKKFPQHQNIITKYTGKLIYK